MKEKPANLLLEKHMAELGLEFERECRFFKLRRWRSDYRITNVLMNGQMVLVEIEGGLFSAGRHNRGKGYQGDLDKYNRAVAMGYAVLRFSTQDVLRGRARAFLAEHLSGRG